MRPAGGDDSDDGQGLLRKMGRKRMCDDCDLLCGRWYSILGAQPLRLPGMGLGADDEPATTEAVWSSRGGRETLADDGGCRCHADITSSG